MDLVSTIRKSGSRGGVNFSWDDVATSAHRENYLGHSLKAPVGRWQQGKDLGWYAKADDDSANPDETDEERRARIRREEIQKIKEAEEDAMAKALGLPPPVRNQSGANAIEVTGSRVGGGDADAAPGGLQIKKEDKEERRDRRRREGRDGRDREHRHRHRHRSRSRSRSRERHRARRPSGRNHEEEPRSRRDAARHRSRSRSRSPGRDGDRHRRHRRPEDPARSRSRSRDYRRRSRSRDGPRDEKYRRRSPERRRSASPGHRRRRRDSLD